MAKFQGILKTIDFEGLHVDMHGQKSTVRVSGRYSDLHENRQSGRGVIFSSVEGYQKLF